MILHAVLLLSSFVAFAAGAFLCWLLWAVVTDPSTWN